MKSQRNNNLIVFAMVILAIVVSSVDSAAQRRLVRSQPSLPNICPLEMWYDLNDPMPKNWVELGRSWHSYFYSKTNIEIEYHNDSAAFVEFRQLSFDSSYIPVEREEYLLDSLVRSTLAVMREALGNVRVKTVSAQKPHSHGRFPGKDRFWVELEFDEYYNVATMGEWLLELVTSSRAPSFPNSVWASDVYCYRLATSVHENPQQQSVAQVSTGGINVEHVIGPYMLVDVRGSIIAQGVGSGGGDGHIRVSPGVYFLATPTERQRILVLP
jgi:hypothetical protein